MPITVHFCGNCNLISEVISQKVKWFDQLTEENVSLHYKLLDEKRDNERLRNEMIDIQDVLAQEREQNLKLYIEREVKQVHNQDGHASGNNHVWNIIRYQKNQYDEQVALLLSSKNARLKEYDIQYKKLNEEYESVLKQLDLFTQELFKQKKENCEKDDLFKKSVKRTQKSLEMHFQQSAEKELKTAEEDIRVRMKDSVRLTNEVLNQRDDLVEKLQQQQLQLEEHIEQLELRNKKANEKAKSEIALLNAAFVKIRKRSEHVEQRRLLDLKGFSTDVKNMTLELKKLQRKLSYIGKGSKAHQDVQCFENELQNFNSKLIKNYSTRLQ